MYKLSKKERLCSKSDIQKLFEKNQFFIHNKIKVFWNQKFSKPKSLKLLISVPKKTIPKAVKRNEMKRLIRESFRINKNLITCQNELHLGLIFLGFEGQLVKENFKDNYNNKDDLYDLEKWEEYEKSNPRVFAGMYQFWCKKI